MILGVDHIAVSGTSLAHDGAVLAGLGFRQRVAVAGLPNPVVKAPLLERYGELHDVAIFEGESGPALELTVHGDATRRAADDGFVPLVALGPSAAPGPADAAPTAIAGAICAAFGLDDLNFVRLPGLETGLWSVPAGAASLKAAVRIVADLAASVGFYRDVLGLRETARGSTDAVTWVRLAAAGLVPKWQMSLLLCVPSDAPQGQARRLDDAGYPCLALLSSDIEADLARVEAQAAWETRTVRFDLVLDGRALKIAYLYGSAGEIVELIEPQRGRRE
jgi:hypothetical protein